MQGKATLLGAFPPRARCWRAALLYGRTNKYTLGVWGQRGGFCRVIGDFLSHTNGQASSASLAPNKPELERWAKTPGWEVWREETARRSRVRQDGNNCQPHSICRLVPGGQLQNRITGT